MLVLKDRDIYQMKIYRYYKTDSWSFAIKQNRM